MRRASEKKEPGRREIREQHTEIVFISRAIIIPGFVKFLSSPRPRFSSIIAFMCIYKHIHTGVIQSTWRVEFNRATRGIIYRLYSSRVETTKKKYKVRARAPWITLCIKKESQRNTIYYTGERTRESSGGCILLTRAQKFAEPDFSGCLCREKASEERLLSIFLRVSETVICNNKKTKPLTL